jgi:hypothetical protein
MGDTAMRTPAEMDKEIADLQATAGHLHDEANDRMTRDLGKGGVERDEAAAEAWSLRQKAKAADLQAQRERRTAEGLEKMADEPAPPEADPYSNDPVVQRRFTELAEESQQIRAKAAAATQRAEAAEQRAKEANDAAAPLEAKVKEFDDTGQYTVSDQPHRMEEVADQLDLKFQLLQEAQAARKEAFQLRDAGDEVKAVARAEAAVRAQEAADAIAPDYAQLDAEAKVSAGYVDPNLGEDPDNPDPPDDIEIEPPGGPTPTAPTGSGPTGDDDIEIEVDPTDGSSPTTPSSTTPSSTAPTPTSPTPSGPTNVTSDGDALQEQAARVRAQAVALRAANQKEFEARSSAASVEHDQTLRQAASARQDADAATAQAVDHDAGAKTWEEMASSFDESAKTDLAAGNKASAEENREAADGFRTNARTEAAAAAAARQAAAEQTTKADELDQRVKDLAADGTVGNQGMAGEKAADALEDKARHMEEATRLERIAAQQRADGDDAGSAATEAKITEEWAQAEAIQPDFSGVAPAALQEAGIPAPVATVPSTPTGDDGLIDPFEETPAAATPSGPAPTPGPATPDATAPDATAPDANAPDANAPDANAPDGPAPVGDDPVGADLPSGATGGTVDPTPPPVEDEGGDVESPAPEDGSTEPGPQVDPIDPAGPAPEDQIEIEMPDASEIPDDEPVTPPDDDQAPPEPDAGAGEADDLGS